MNSYTNIASLGQSTIALTPTNNTLTVASTGALTVTTNALTNTLQFNLSSSNLIVNTFTVSGALTLAPTTLGLLDNITIGSVTPSAATFTNLSVTSSAILSPVNGTITISPSGTGTLAVYPATTGTIDNMTIGATVPGTGTFSSITLTGTQPTSSSSVVTKNYVAALSAAYGVALS